MVKKDKYSKFCRKIIRLICKLAFFGLIGNFIIFQLIDYRFCIKPLNILAFGLAYYMLERIAKLFEN